MRETGVTVLVGLVTGFVSGQFGIGGGLVSTPAIKLVLGRPDLIAVGTPLLVIIPTALAGAVSYARRGISDMRSGLVIGAFGSLTAVVGALASRYAGGAVVLMLTAVLIAFNAVEMLRSLPERDPADGVVGEPVVAGVPALDDASVHADASAAMRAGDAEGRPSLRRLAGVGLLAGAYSGFLGLGGGFVIVPMLMRRFGFSAKQAIGTSLAAIAVQAVPGSIAHFALGHVDVGLALGLTVGVVPGAMLGARVTAAAKERVVRISFACVLLAVGVVLGVAELAELM